MATKYVDDTIKKVKQLEPNDPVRRGLLECLADLFLAKGSRKVHEVKRVEKRRKLLKF